MHNLVTVQPTLTQCRYSIESVLHGIILSEYSEAVTAPRCADLTANKERDHIYEYTSLGCKKQPPSSCIVPFRRRGAVVERTTYLTRAEKGREGWVYLIHAEGTNRYKIGRSANPVARHQTLQNQSPFPLTIIDSFWTIYTIKDEATLHRVFADFRVYGEWFEFKEYSDQLFDYFYHLQWAGRCAAEFSDYLLELSYVGNLASNEEKRQKFKTGVEGELYDLYRRVNSVDSFNYVQSCLEALIERMTGLNEANVAITLKEIALFIIGVLTGLAFSLEQQEKAR